MSTRNNHAKETLTRVLLPTLEVGRAYTNRQAFDLAVKAGIDTGYSTVGQWMMDMVEEGQLQRTGKGVYMRRKVVQGQSQGVLPLQETQQETDPIMRELRAINAKLDRLMLATAKGA